MESAAHAESNSDSDSESEEAADADDEFNQGDDAGESDDFNESDERGNSGQAPAPESSGSVDAAQQPGERASFTAETPEDLAAARRASQIVNNIIEAHSSRSLSDKPEKPGFQGQSGQQPRGFQSGPRPQVPGGAQQEQGRGGRRRRHRRRGRGSDQPRPPGAVAGTNLPPGNQPRFASPFSRPAIDPSTGQTAALSSRPLAATETQILQYNAPTPSAAMTSETSAPIAATPAPVKSPAFDEQPAANQIEPAAATAPVQIAASPLPEQAAKMVPTSATARPAGYPQNRPARENRESRDSREREGREGREGRDSRESSYESTSVTPQQAPANVRKVVLLNASEPGDVRVAILENNELAEIFMERKSRGQQAGNIYKGKVVNVEPSLQAAFIDLGTERNGFLHASDCIPPDGGYQEILNKPQVRAAPPRFSQPAPSVPGRHHVPAAPAQAAKFVQPLQTATHAAAPSVAVASATASAQVEPAAGLPGESAHAPVSAGNADSAATAAPSIQPVPNGGGSAAGNAPQSDGTSDTGASAVLNPNANAGLNGKRRRRRRGGRRRSGRSVLPGMSPMIAPASQAAPVTEPAPSASTEPAVAVAVQVTDAPEAQVTTTEAVPESANATSAETQESVSPPASAPESAGSTSSSAVTEGRPAQTPLETSNEKQDDDFEDDEDADGDYDNEEESEAADESRSAAEQTPPETAVTAPIEPAVAAATPQSAASPQDSVSSEPATPERESISSPESHSEQRSDVNSEDQNHEDNKDEDGEEVEGDENEVGEEHQVERSENAVRHETESRSEPAPNQTDDSTHSNDSNEDAEEAEEADHEEEEEDEEETNLPSVESGASASSSENVATAPAVNTVQADATPASTSAADPAARRNHGEVRAPSAHPIHRPRHSIPPLPAPGRPAPSFAPNAQRSGGGRSGRERHDRRYTIQEMLREGQEVIVQVAKEGIGQKGPALTTYLSMPGRHLVLMPAVQRLGVSKRIENEDQRRALKTALNQLNPPSDMGVIVRTAGIGRSAEELRRDLDYLMAVWETLKKKAKTVKAPALIFQEGDVVTRVFRDVITEDVTEIVIDDPGVLERAREFLRDTAPGSEKKLKLHSDPEPLFHKYGVEQQMQRLFNRKVNLRSGGSIVIEQTEALVAIDVNTGRAREKRNQDDTILQTNLEASREIARQLRLRDIGGLVMIDFIDMEIHEHRRRVERELKQHLARDKARLNVLPVSSLGVVEMTRQRIRHSLRKTLFDRCPHCSGSGHVKSPESIGLEMLREIKSQLKDTNVRRVKVLLHSLVAFAILNQFRKELSRLEEAEEVTIEVCGDPGVQLSQMQVSTAKEGGEWVIKKVSEVDDYVRNS